MNIPKRLASNVAVILCSNLLQCHLCSQLETLQNFIAYFDTRLRSLNRLEYQTIVVSLMSLLNCSTFIFWMKTQNSEAICLMLDLVAVKYLYCHLLSRIYLLLSLWTQAEKNHLFLKHLWHSILL